MYIAGPYHAPTRAGRERSIVAAEKTLAHFVNAGVVAFCPHTHFAHFDEKADAPRNFYLAADLEFLRRCDGLFLMPNWEFSAGSINEKTHAEDWGIPIFEDLSMCIEWARRT